MPRRLRMEPSGQGRYHALAQIASIFLTGSLYGWLRLDSGSTVPPLFAHSAYNAALFGVAFLR